MRRYVCMYSLQHLTRSALGPELAPRLRQTPPDQTPRPHAFGVAAPTACHAARVGNAPGWLTSGQPCDTRFAGSSRMVEMGVCTCSEVIWGGDVRHVGEPMKEFGGWETVLRCFALHHRL